jgi:translation elongation factor EF-Tu-like GTPase
MFRLTVEDIFAISGRGTVVTGRVEEGSLSVGDEVRINGERAVRVDGIEAFRKKIEVASAGDNIGLLFAGLGRDDFKRGDVLTAEGGFVTPAAPDQSDQLRAAEEALGRKPSRWYRFGR